MSLEWPGDYVNKIICGDCLEVMKEMPDKCVDLVVTSPPYDSLRNYGGYVFNFEAIAKELYRIAKHGSIVVWIVGDAVIDGSETGTSFKQALYFKKIGFRLFDTMIYVKDSPSFPDASRYHQVFEYMFILSKDKPSTFHPIKDRKNRWEKSFGAMTKRNKEGDLIKQKQMKTSPFGKRFNLWKYHTGFDPRDCNYITEKHPAVFPFGLAKDHIISWTDKGALILDPLCGSGTTCEVAKKYKRNFIGIEINPEYCKIAEERLAQGVL